jgi:hypothetical protein
MSPPSLGSTLDRTPFTFQTISSPGNGVCAEDSVFGRLMVQRYIPDGAPIPTSVLPISSPVLFNSTVTRVPSDATSPFTYT